MIDPPVITHGAQVAAVAEVLPVLADTPAPAPENLPVLVDGQAGAPKADWPVNAVLQSDGSVVLTLQSPVVLRYKDGQGATTEEVFKSLTMGPINGKARLELRKAKEDDFEVVAIGCSAGIFLAKMQLIYNLMDARDIGAALRVYRFFTTPGLRTGP